MTGKNSRYYEGIIVCSEQGHDVILATGKGVLATAEEAELTEFYLGTFEGPPWTAFPGIDALVAWISEEVSEGRGTYIHYRRSTKGFKPWVLTNVGGLGNAAA